MDTMTYQSTSRDAWRSFLPHSPKLDDMILAVLTVAPSTCEEIEQTIGRSHQAVSGNLRHLVERGAARHSGEYGRTTSGRKAMIWTL
jgi:predicted transcriptional regulator